ncbi:MAG: ZinT/AdcA family metal-binding protein [Treponema sp.]|jgi:Zn/Cd-binding protein ZinT|nr:ZinT/AdcA family metal-binding protein [Treponema sp.]
MKRFRKQDVFFVVLLAAMIFILTGCSNGSTDDEPELAKWSGVWNNVVEYLDEDWLQQTLEDAVETIGNNVTVAQLKTFLTTRLGTDFKSCAIDGDSITLHPNIDATGMANRIAIAYKEKIETTEHSGGEHSEHGEHTYWYAFEGNKNDHKYWIAMLPEHHSEEFPVVFHFRYGDSSFDAVIADTGRSPTVIRQGATQEQIKNFLTESVRYIPAAAFQ